MINGKQEAWIFFFKNFFFLNCSCEVKIFENNFKFFFFYKLNLNMCLKAGIHSGWGRSDQGAAIQ